MSLISPMVQIVVMGSDNKVYESQLYSEFINKPNLNIQLAAYGSTLLDLLTQENFLTEKLELSQILTGNAHADATRLCGHLAEVLVVKYCHESQEVNRTLAKYARFGKKETKSLDNFLAIGTASKLTKISHSPHYQPNDTQRDIIWVNKLDSTKQLECIGSTSNSSKPAGLQIKASHDGCKYVVPNIQDYSYPILYFDISDDWYRVQSVLQQNKTQAELIHPDEIMKEIKSHLVSYYKIIYSLINNEITVKQVINIARYHGDSVLIAGLSASELQGCGTIIL